MKKTRIILIVIALIAGFNSTNGQGTPLNHQIEYIDLLKGKIRHIELSREELIAAMKGDTIYLYVNNAPRNFTYFGAIKKDTTESKSKSMAAFNISEYVQKTYKIKRLPYIIIECPDGKKIKINPDHF